MTTNSSRYPIWTREEDKTFEKGLALYGNIDQWAKIAAMIPGKSIEEVKEHYQLLVDDIMSIEAGNVPLPDYGSSSEILADLADGSPEDLGLKKRSAKSTADRRKSIPWTDEEHGLFLQGMDTLGRGDWRGIARHYVMTRTPAQVASHAQKYFKRMEPGKKKRRPTIHDGPVDGGNKSGGQRKLVEGESSQFPIKIADLGEFPVQTPDIGMHRDNIIPAHQGIIPAPWMTGIGMHDKHTNYFGMDTLDNISTPQGCNLPIGPMTGIGIGGGATEVFQFDTRGCMSYLQGAIPNAHMTFIGTEAPINMPVSERPVFSAEKTGIGMGYCADEVFQFDTLGNISYLQGAIGIGTEALKNMSVSQGPVFSAERAGIGMGGGATEVFQFDAVGSISSLQGAIGIGIEAPKNIPISQGPILYAERTGISMGGDATEFFQFDPLLNLSSLQGDTGIGIEAPKNIPISQGPILYAERTDSNMGGDATELFQFDPLLDLSSLQGAIGIGIEAPKNMAFSQEAVLIAERAGVAIDTTPIMHQFSRSAQTCRFAGMDFASGMPVQQMPFNAHSTSLAPMDTVDDSGSVIPPTDVGTFGFCPTTRHLNN